MYLIFRFKQKIHHRTTVTVLLACPTVSRSQDLVLSGLLCSSARIQLWSFKLYTVRLEFTLISMHDIKHKYTFCCHYKTIKQNLGQKGLYIKFYDALMSATQMIHYLQISPFNSKLVTSVSYIVSKTQYKAVGFYMQSQLFLLSILMCEFFTKKSNSCRWQRTDLEYTFPSCRCCCV